MLKPILTFFGVCLLCACATARIGRSGTDEARTYVDFFAADKTQAAFKVTGRLEEFRMEGVVTAKKTEEGVQVGLLSGGIFRVLDAVVTPQEVQYRYVLSEVDNSLVRGRMTQLLDLLFLPPGQASGAHTKNGQTRITYKGPRAKTVLVYQGENSYPSSARTVTALNGADLTYADYMPLSADGETKVPHELVYQDGKITLEMELISLR